MDISYEAPRGAAPAGPHLPPTYRGLPRPLRLFSWVLFATLTGLVVGRLFPEALRLLGTAAALEPAKLAWYGVRITGLVAYLALAAAVLYGLLLSTRMLDSVLHRPASARLHQELALAALAVSALHGLLLLADGTYAFTPAAIAIPFASPYAPVAVAVGQIAFYGVAVVAASYYVRRRIGTGAWRSLHYLTFLAFVGVTAHGLAAGTDAATAWGVWVYLAPASATAFLVTYRLVVGLARRRPLSSASPAR